MQIDDKLLTKLQKLGMIEIDEDKQEEVKTQLSEILGFVDNIATLDTQNVEFSSDLKTPMREDEVCRSSVRDEVLSHAPNAQDGFFVVPKIIE